jgi:hypothetical protein
MDGSRFGACRREAYVEAGAWADPELLERLKTRAKRFTLGDGQTETMDLKLAEIAQ